MAPELPRSHLRRQRFSELRKQQRADAKLSKPPKRNRRGLNTKVTASSRVDSLRKSHNPESPVDRGRIYADSKNDRVYCGYCCIFVKNKTYNIRKHFETSEIHTKKVNAQKEIAMQEKATLDNIVVAAPTPVGHHVVDAKTQSTRQNFVRHTIKAGIPMNTMDEMNDFNTAHYDFSIARMSDMADIAIPKIIEEELAEVIKEMLEAGFVVLGFDGTTHYGEASFFGVRYRYRGEVKSKCIGVKHADHSTAGLALCKLLKFILRRSQIPFTVPETAESAPTSTSTVEFLFSQS